MLHVFLGGTCNGSTWRDELLGSLHLDQISVFNPVIEHWDETCVMRENEYKNTCDYEIFVITPKMKGVYSIYEVTKAACLKPENTVFCILSEYENERFDEITFNSLNAIANSISEMGVNILYSLKEVANFLNGKVSKRWVYSD